MIAFFMKYTQFGLVRSSKEIMNQVDALCVHLDLNLTNAILSRGNVIEEGWETFILLGR